MVTYWNVLSFKGIASDPIQTPAQAATLDLKHHDEVRHQSTLTLYNPLMDYNRRIVSIANATNK